MSDAATQAQTRAARPEASTWVSANAGSGKTRVLTNRVARLLLSGAEPHRILCLTYTKAAAAEMQSRLFAELGTWAMMPRADLMATLAALGEDTQTISDQKLAKARRLFAQALETPGGLKIQTIHAFCGALLRQFPLEAGVSPGFRELDDLQAQQVQDDVLDAMAQSDPEGVFAQLVYHLGDGDLEGLIAEILKHRQAFRAGPASEDYEVALSAERGLILGVMMDDIAGGLTRNELMDWASVLRGGGKTDLDIANGLVNFAKTRNFDYLINALLTAGKTARKTLGTAAIKKIRPDIPERLHGLAGEVAEAHQRYFASLAAQRSIDLARFAHRFLGVYDARKSELGVLDFDDLIERSGALLSNPDYGSWVLYRLDGGLDHVLIDEAQDTSPPQWDLIKSLTEAFFDGEGSARQGRTIFVVGDKKQSIYSFQGADPRVFDQMQAYFAERLAPVSEGLAKSELLYSFRTAPQILRLVDAVMQAEGEAVEHLAFHGERPGRIELWPFLENPEKEEETPWFDPQDKPSPADPALRLAADIAEFIAERVARGKSYILPGTHGEKGGEKIIQPKDFLILVSRRSKVFHGIITALKAAGVPVAGSDRLNVNGELAVRDVLALLRFAVSPNDDLSLAAALRSPLFGVSEGELFTLAHGRRSTLIESLKEHEGFGEMHATLSDLMNDVDYERPFEMLDKILTKLDGRRKLVARLGREAEDGIDELLSQSLIYEESEAPTLSGFLDWIANDDQDVKRQNDDARNEVRVMTVHGAKGLEAPIVILPETGKRDFSKNKPSVQADESGLPFWVTGGKETQPAPLVEIEEARQLRAKAEDNRLLYVAMTRAERWLIVGGFGPSKDKIEGSWYDKIEAAMQASSAQSMITSDGAMLYLDEDWTVDARPANEAEADAAVALPEWIDAAVPASAARIKPLSPSDLGGAHSLPGEHDDTDARKRGTDIHRLLEYLPDYPEAEWSEIAQALVGDVAADLLPEVRKTLTASYPIPVFASDALQEVAISGSLEGISRPMSGVIDRLVITDEAVWAVDFKSNRIVPGNPEETPEKLKRQMGAYLGLLAQIYPGKAIRVAILWTTAAKFVELTHEDVRQSVNRAALA